MALPVISIYRSSSAAGKEGNSGSTAFGFTVLRNGDRTSSLSLDWVVAAGSADATDFSGGELPSGTLFIPQNEWLATITVMVNGDQLWERDENFFVQFLADDSVVYEIDSADGEIQNDDVSRPPVINAPIADQTVVPAEAFSFDTASFFSDPDFPNDDLSFLTSSLPGWLRFDSQQGVFYGTPSVSDAGATKIRVTARDLAANEVSEEFYVVARRGKDIGFTQGKESFDDQLAGTPGTDDLFGFSGNDVLSGLAENDFLDGNEGADVLDGGTGVDIMRGGSGGDTYVVDNAGDQVIETDNSSGSTLPEGDPGSVIDRVEASISYALTNFVENLQLLEAAGAYNGNGNDLDNLLLGNGLANSLMGFGGKDSLYGWGGDDRLTGGAGDDLLNGGVGEDTGVFELARASYSVQKLSSSWKVKSLDVSGGTDTLELMERLQFADQTISLLPVTYSGVPGYEVLDRFFFDSVYFMLANPGLSASVTPASAAEYYISTGAAQGARPNAWFDAAYYEAKWQDLAAVHFDTATLFRHFNLYGVWEGRSPGPIFDTFNGARYLQDNPDVAAYVDAHLADFLGSPSNGALAHYMIYGSGEGRVSYNNAGEAIDLGYVL